MAKSETAIAAKFRAAGYDKDDYALGAAVIAYRKTGGSLNQALKIVREAFERQVSGIKTKAVSNVVMIQREPTAAARAASRHVAGIGARITIFDSLKIDGRPVGDFTVGEARSAGHAKTREGHILLAALKVVANVKGDELLRSVVKLREMERIVQNAAEVADVAAGK